MSSGAQDAGSGAQDAGRAPTAGAPNQRDDSRPLVSLIVPAYNEAESAPGIVELFHEIERTYEAYRFELVVVDDGSVDGTADVLRKSLDSRDRALVASLSRNFGSHAAISAGLALGSGDCALTLSADLQEPVGAIGSFLDKWQDGYDVVWGLRRTRAVTRGLSSFLAVKFSVLLHAASEIPTYPRQGPSQVLVSRRVVDVVTAMPESNRNVLGMIAWSGFRQTEIWFDQLPRPHGASKWTRQKKIKLVLDSFVEFSSAPVRWIGYAGILTALVGLLLALVVLAVALVRWDPPSGMGLVASLVLAVGGANLVALQAIGEYVWRGGYDARRRPVYVLADVSRHAPQGRVT